MKKSLITCLLIIAMLVTLLCVPSYAADGKYTITVERSVNASIQGDGVDYPSTNTYETESSTFSLKYDDTEGGKYYILYVFAETWNDNWTSGDTLAKNAVFMDQKTADAAAGVTYSMTLDLKTDQTLYMYVVPQGGTHILVATCEYKVGYKLGDVDMNTRINATDALLTLKSSVGSYTLSDTQRLAADVDRNKRVNATDALMILKYSVGSIKSFD